jgi:hypothetical protein
VARKPGHRGEHGISRKTIAQETPGKSGEPVVNMLVCFTYFAREAAGAAGTRRFLRPLLSEGSGHTSDASRRENAESCIQAGSAWFHHSRRTHVPQEEGEVPCSSALAIERKSCHAMRL